MIYLDYQATTPLAPEAFEAMLPWLRDQHANPHSPHRPGRAAKAAVEVAREQIAALMPPGGGVVFTGGATESLNWSIKGIAGPVVTVATEHAAVLDTVAAEAARGREVTVLPVGHGGLVDLEFTVHTLQLSHGIGLDPRLEVALAALVEKGLIDDGADPDLRLLSRLLVVLRLVAPDAQEPAVIFGGDNGRFGGRDGGNGPRRGLAELGEVGVRRATAPGRGEAVILEARDDDGLRPELLFQDRARPL